MTARHLTVEVEYRVISAVSLGRWTRVTVGHFYRSELIGSHVQFVEPDPPDGGGESAEPALLAA